MIFVPKKVTDWYWENDFWQRRAKSNHEFETGNQVMSHIGHKALV